MQTGGADDRAARLSIRSLVPPIRPAAAPNFPAVTRKKDAHLAGARDYARSLIRRRYLMHPPVWFLHKA